MHHRAARMASSSCADAQVAAPGRAVTVAINAAAPAVDPGRTQLRLCCIPHACSSGVSRGSSYLLWAHRGGCYEPRAVARVAEHEP